MKVSKKRLTQIVTEELKKTMNEGDEDYESRSYLDKDTGKLKSRDPAEAEYQRGMDAVGQIGALVERQMKSMSRTGDTFLRIAPLLSDLTDIMDLCDAYWNGQEIPRFVDADEERRGEWS